MEMAWESPFLPRPSGISHDDAGLRNVTLLSLQDDMTVRGSRVVVVRRHGHVLRDANIICCKQKLNYKKKKWRIDNFCKLD